MEVVHFEWYEYSLLRKTPEMPLLKPTHTSVFYMAIAEKSLEAWEKRFKHIKRDYLITHAIMKPYLKPKQGKSLGNTKNFYAILIQPEFNYEQTPLFNYILDKYRR